MLFQLAPGGILGLNSNWEKILGFRNIQEKLEKIGSPEIFIWYFSILIQVSGLPIITVYLIFDKNIKIAFKLNTYLSNQILISRV